MDGRQSFFLARDAKHPSITQSQQRWTPLTGYISTPLDNRHIVFTNLVALNDQVAGLPIRWQLQGDRDTYYFGQISAINSNFFSVDGQAITGTISKLWVGTPEMVVQIDLFFPGAFAATAGNILSSIGKSSFISSFSSARLTYFTATCNTPGGSASQVNVMVNGVAANAISISGISGESGTNILKTTLLYGQTLDVAVTTIDATDADLTVSITLVLE